MRPGVCVTSIHVDTYVSCALNRSPMATRWLRFSPSPFCTGSFEQGLWLSRPRSHPQMTRRPCSSLIWKIENETNCLPQSVLFSPENGVESPTWILHPLCTEEETLLVFQSCYWDDWHCPLYKGQLRSLPWFQCFRFHRASKCGCFASNKSLKNIYIHFYLPVCRCKCVRGLYMWV